VIAKGGKSPADRAWTALNLAIRPTRLIWPFD
jgi:hypothetical protein